MTLQSSGAISFSQLQTEFGGANPISMSEYYAGGANVPSSTSGVNGAVPTSGTISMSKFYGTSDVAFSPEGGGDTSMATTLFDYKYYPDTASVTITCTQAAVWTWSRSGDTQGSPTVASGGSATSITFNLPSSNTAIRQTNYSVSATAAGITRYWIITLTTEPLL